MSSASVSALHALVTNLNPSDPLNVLLSSLNAILDKADMLQGGEFDMHGSLIQKLCAVIDTRVPPVFTDDSLVDGTSPDAVRKRVYDIMFRIPPNEAVKPHVIPLARSLTAAFQSDNEDNAVLAVQPLFQLHKQFRAVESLRPDLEALAREALLYARAVYTQLTHSVTQLVNGGVLSTDFTAAAYAAASPTGGEGFAAPARRALEELDAGRVGHAESYAMDLSACLTGRLEMLPACASFKFASELPLLIILLIQVRAHAVSPPPSPFVRALYDFMPLLSPSSRRTRVSLLKQ
jgi:hypothetical protein